MCSGSVIKFMVDNVKSLHACRSNVLRFGLESKAITVSGAIYLKYRTQMVRKFVSSHKVLFILNTFTGLTSTILLVAVKTKSGVSERYFRSLFCTAGMP